MAVKGRDDQQRRPHLEEVEARVMYSADALGGLEAGFLGRDNEPVLEAGLVPGKADVTLEQIDVTEHENNTRNEIVFVDANLENREALIADITGSNDAGRSITVVVLDSSEDGITQISRALEQHEGIDAIHLVSHGQSGSVQLGSISLDQTTLEKRSAEIQGWGLALDQDADLLIYGCDLAASEAGRILVDNLGGLTGADAAASDDLTGAAYLGGDWELEYSTGRIETSIAAASGGLWSGVLANAAVDASNSSSTTNQASVTFSHTTSGSDRLLLVGISMHAAGETVDSVTYNGVALTPLGSKTDGGGEAHVEIWQLVAPATGANNVVVTLSGTGHEGVVVGATSFVNVDQATPTSNFTTDIGSSGTGSITITSAVNDLVFGVVNSENGTTAVPDGSQTEEWDVTAFNSNGSGSVKAGAASVNLSWSINNDSWVTAGVSVNSAAAAPIAQIFSLDATTTVSEETSDTVTFTLTLAGDPLTGGDTASVDVTAAGTATSGTDYDNLVSTLVTVAAATTGVTFDGTDTLTFDSSFNAGAGEGSFVFTVDAIDDVDVEGTETLVAQLSNPTSTAGSAALATFKDTFTEGSDTLLTSHTPATGMSWTEIYETSGTGATVDSSIDAVRGGVDLNSTGQAYTIGPAPTSADQTLSFTLSEIDTSTGTKPVGLFARLADNSNFYFLQILPNDNGQDSIQLIKMDSGTDTTLVGIDATIAANDTFKLELVGTTLKAYHNDVEVLSTTDVTFSAAGDWGVFFGNFGGEGHLRSTWAVDNVLASVPSNVTTTTSITETDVPNVNPSGSGSLTTTSLNDNAGASNLFGGLSVTDPDGESDLSLKITLTDPTAGTITGGGFTETGVGTGIYTVTGLTTATADTALDNVQFTPTNNSGPSGNFTTDISVQVNDQGGGGDQTVLAATTVTITRVNDNPSGAGSLTTTSLNDNAGATSLYGGLSVTDADVGENDLSLTITLTDPTAGTITGGGFTETGVGTGIYTVTGLTTATSDTALDNLQFTPTNNTGSSGNFTTDMSITVNDQGGGGEQNVLSATTVTITRVNDNPSGSGSLTTTTLNDNAGASSLFGGLSTSDVDVGENDLSLKITLTDPTAGTITGGGFTETGVGTGIYTVTGLTTATADTALDNVQFTPTNNSGPSGNFTTDISVQVNDQGGGGDQTVLTATTVTITRVNDNPAGSGSLTTTALNDNAGATSLYGGLSVTDADVGENDLSLTITLTDPTSGTITGGGFTETGVGTGIYTVTGLTTATSDTALDNLQFTPTNNTGPSGNFTTDMSITVNDQGGGGEQTVLSATTVTITRVNDNPSGSGSLTTTTLNDNAGASSLFGGLSTSDVDVGENDLSLKITLTDPTAGTITGGGFTETGVGTGIYTVTGLTTATANTALDNLQFTPTNNTGPSGNFTTDMSITVNDQGGGGEQTVLAATTVTITRVNDNPAGSGSLTTTSLNDNAGATSLYGGLSVTDADVGENDLSLTITLTDPTSGTITGGGFTETGVGTGIYTVTGLTTATSDTALDNLQFTPTNNTGPSGNFTTDMSITVNDQGGGGEQTVLAATTVTITRVNDNPAGSGSLTTTSLNDNAGATSLYGGLSVTDADVGENDLSLTITLTDPTSGTITGGGFTETGVGTGIYTVTGLTTATSDTALDNLQFTPTNNTGPSGNFTTDMSITVNDQGGGGEQTVLAATTVTITRVNDNPAGSGSLTTTSLNDNAGATSLYGGLSVTDADVGENDLSLTITLTDPTSGTITGGGFTETGVGTGIYTVTGLTTATSDTALDNLQFTPTNNTGTSGNFTTDMSITVNDQGGGGEQSVLAATTVTITRVNDNPSGSGSLTTTTLNDNAGASSLFGGLSTSDVDVGENDLSLKITLTDPTAGTITGGGFTETGVGTGIYTVTGLTTATADTALDNVQFTPTNNSGPSGNFTTDISVQVNDQGGGGDQTVLAATTVTITRVNDNPAGSGSLTMTALNDNAGATSLYGGLSVTDADVGENDLSLTITLTDPTSGTITGGGFTETGVGTGIYTVTGLTTTTADTALDNLQFTPTNNTGPSGNFTTDMSITVNDQGGGGEQTVLAATTVTITRVNDDPAGSGSLTTTSLNDNAGASSLFGGLSTSDVDVGENDLSLKITLTDPTAGTITGGGFTETGVGTGIYTVTGLTTTTANTALDNLQFTPTNNTGPSGNFTTDISVQVNDQGGGGDQTVLAATTVTITRVNDNPAGSGSLTTTSLNDNAGATSLYGGLSVTDVDVGENDLSLTITLADSTAGTITGGGFTETGVGTGIYTVTGLTTTTADTALDNLQFTPTNNTGPSGNFTTDMSITVNDQGGGGEQTVLAATTVTITRVNDDPAGSGSLTTTSLNDNAGASSLFGGLSTSDVDVGENDLSLKITLTDPTAGTITGGGFTETGVGTGIYTVTGLTTTTANTALDNLQFTPTNNTGPSGNFTTDISVQVNDQGGGGDQTVLAATTVTITRVNDNPAGSGSLTTTALNDNAGATSLYGGLSVTDADVGENDLSLTITLADSTAGTITGGGFTETGVGTGIYTVTGLTTATADTALDNLQFTPTNNTGPSGNFTTDMSITVNDQGGGGEQTVLAATTVTITRVNDNPAGTGSLTTTTLNDNAGASSLFGGLSTSDVDVGENDLSLKITLTDPTAGTITGGGFTETGVGTGIYTVTGLTTTTADTALDNVQFTPTNNSGPSGTFTTDISVQVNDQSGGGDQTVLAATTVTITRLNDNPAGSGSLTTTSLNDNAGATSLYGGLSVTDADVGENDLSLTITLTDPTSGTITGGGFTETGVGTGIYTVTGLTTATSDTALDNLQFTPTNNTGPSGNFTTDMSITVNDQGGGGEQTVLAATTVTITRVNDNPAGSGSLTTTTLNDNAGASSLFGGLSTSDVDVGENDLSLKITLTDPSGGTITGGGFTETGVGTGIYTVTGLTTTTADTALDNVQFTPTNNTGPSGTFTTDISVQVNDQGGGGDQTVLAATTVTITRLNDNPAGSGSLTTTTLNDNAGASSLFGGLSTSDVDVGENDLSLKITLTDPTAGTITGGGFTETVVGTGIYTVTGLTTTAANTALDNLQFTPTNNTGPSGTFTTDISVQVNDQGGGGDQTVLAATTVTITRLNDNPAGSGSLTTTSLNDNAGATSLYGGLSVTDADVGENDLSLTITLTDPTAGTITGGGFTETGVGTGIYTVTGLTTATADTALDNLQFTPTNNTGPSGNFTTDMSITVNDQGGGGEQTVLAATTVTITRVNDNPAGSGSLTTISLNDNAGASSLFGGLSTSDVDVGENDLSLKITLTDPTAGTITGGGFTETGVGTGIYTVTGLTTTTADAALDNVQFTPTNNTGPSGTFNTDISVQVNDQGGGGDQTVLAATTVTITRVNDNPAGSGSLTTTSLNDNAGATSLYGGLSVTDADVGENDLSLTITLTDPTSGTITGGGFTETGVGTGIYTVTGLTTATADTALDNLQFTPTNNTGPSGNFTTDMSITVNDQGGGGEQTVLAATTVTITRVNDNPAGSGSLTTTSLNDNVGATSLYGGLSVTDADVGENDLSLTITLTDPTSGTITGGGFTETGVGTGIYTVTGLTTATSDTALNNLQFTPTNNTGPSGNFTTDMSITVNDQGGGGEQTVLAATTVTITRVNDNPAGSGSLTTTTLNDNAGASSLFGGLSTSDVDVGENDLSLKITLTDPTAGTITGGGFTETGVGTGIYTVTGLTTTTADTALDNVQFTPTNNTGPSGTFNTDISVQVNDQGGGGDQTVLAATTVTITRINDNPAGAGSLTTTSLNDSAGASSLYGGLSVTDVDVGENDLSLTVTLTDPTSGTITGGGFTETGVGTGIYTVTGLTTTTADTALDNLQFTPTNNTGTSGNFTTDMSITVNDQGGGGEQAVLAPTTVTITRVNDNPAGAGSLTTTSLNDNAGASSLYGGLSVTDVDVGENDLSLTVTLADPTSGTITGGGFTETGVGTGIYTVTGLTTTTADTALDNLQFTPTNNTGPSGNFTTDMSITVNDQGGGGDQTVLAATTVTITRVNDNPAGSGSLTTTSLNDNAGATSLYGGLSVTDVDVGENDLSLTITLTDPTSGTITGGGFTETGVGTGIYTVTGLTTTTADTALDNLQFTPTNNTGPSGNFTTDMSITVNDQGGGGEQIVLAPTTLTISRVNDNPAGAGSLTTTSLNDNVGASSLFGGLSTSDVDVGENDLSLKITLTDPTAGTITGGGFTETGVGTGIYTVTGLTTTTADTALDNVQFTPTNNTGPSGTFNTDISVQVNDQGGGGDQTVLAATTVTITRINDNPAGAGSLTTTSLNDSAGASSLYGGLSVTGVDVGENDLSLTVTLTDPTSGTITGGDFAETGVGTGIYTFTGLTTTTADTALDNLQFTPTNNTGPSGNFTTDMSITVNDQGGGGEQTVLAPTTVTITRVNDNPVGAGSLTTTSLNDNVGASSLFGGLSTSDVDVGENDLSLKITLTDPTAGTITGGGFTETGAGTGIYTVTGLTTTTADTALDNLQFTPTNNTGPSGNFTTDISITVNDQGGGGEQTVLAPTTVTITRVNDNPAGAGSLTTTSLNDNAGASSLFGGLSTSDVDLGENDLLLKITLTDPTAGTITGGGFTETEVGTGIYTVTGLTTTTADTALDNVQFTPTSNTGQSGSFTTDISVQVNDQGGGGDQDMLPATTLTITRVGEAPTGIPGIEGSVVEDQLLTVDTLEIADSDGLGTFNYQWLRNGVEVAGASEPAYLLDDVDVGSLISVRVSYVDGDSNLESLTSLSTEPVANINDTPEGKPVVVGTSLQNQTLTVDTDSITDADGLGVFAFQWLRDGVAIADATGSDYLVQNNDIGTRISVRISYVDGESTPESLTSEPGEVVNAATQFVVATSAPVEEILDSTNVRLLGSVATNPDEIVEEVEPEPEPESEPEAAEASPDAEVEQTLVPGLMPSIPSGEDRSTPLDKRADPRQGAETQNVIEALSFEEVVTQLFELSDNDVDTGMLINETSFVRSESDRESLRQNLKRVSEEMEEAAKEEQLEDRVINAAFKAGGIVGSGGGMAWLLRGASMFASALSMVPTWRGFDPLPILEESERRQPKGRGSTVPESTPEDEIEAKVGQVLDSLDTSGDDKNKPEGPDEAQQK